MSEKTCKAPGCGKTVVPGSGYCEAHLAERTHRWGKVLAAVGTVASATIFVVGLVARAVIGKRKS